MALKATRLNGTSRWRRGTRTGVRRNQQKRQESRVNVYDKGKVYSEAGMLSRMQCKTSGSWGRHSPGTEATSRKGFL